MTTQWLGCALTALLLSFVVACGALVLAAARGAWNRHLDLGGVRGLRPRTVLCLRGTAAVAIGSLIATAVGTYAAVISLGLFGLIRSLL